MEDDSLQVIEKMVARDGVEPPTPAFSDLVQPKPTTTYWLAGDCQVPANTYRAEQTWAGIMGWKENEYPAMSVIAMLRQLTSHNAVYR